MDNSGETRNTATAVIPKGTVINGNIEVTGRLVMYGEVHGDIKSDSRVSLRGDVQGNIYADALYTKDSLVRGHIECARDAVVRDNAVILGDISAENLVVDGAIQGSVDIKNQIMVGAKAVMDSDIRAKCLQVSDGASINGKCSLCYADVDVREYFPVEDEPELPEASATGEQAPADTAGQGSSDTVNAAGQASSDTANTAGQALSETSDTAGQALSDAANTAGQAQAPQDKRQNNGKKSGKKGNRNHNHHR